MKIENEFIPYEQALELKELGFDEPCFWWYDFEKELRKDRIGVNSINSKYFLNGSSCSAPLYQQVFRWFREKYGYDVTIKKCTPSEYKFEIEQLFVEGNNYYFIDFSFDTYEEAEVACLRKLIEIVKTNKI
jgi:hypothetical protein